MLNRRITTFFLAALFTVSAAAMMGRHVDAEPAEKPDPATEADPADDGPKQVMKNLELMKFLFEPFAIDLRQRAQIEPENRHEWQSLYVATYRLGEAMNLLYCREGKDYMQTDDWRRMVTESRQAVLDLGQVVKKRDFVNIQVRYERVIEGCNDCHRKCKPDDPTIIQAW